MHQPLAVDSRQQRPSDGYGDDFALPRDLEAERQLLGCMLHDHDCIDDVAALVGADDFAFDANQRVFKAMLAVRERSESAIPTTVWHELMRRGDSADVKADYLNDLWECVATSGVAVQLAKIVRNNGTVKRCRLVAQTIFEATKQPGANGAQILDLAEREFFGIGERQATDLVVLREVLPKVTDEIEARAHQTGQRGPLTGLLDVDEILCGLAPGELVIIGARPSVGKTALACSVVLTVAKAGVPCIVFSLEQSSKEIAERFLVMEAGADSHACRRGSISTNDFRVMTDAMDRLWHAGIFIDEGCNRSMTQIAASVRRAVRKHRVGLVVIDYLQLIEPESGKTNREQQIAAITRRAKLLAREARLPVLLLAQLNRESESGHGRRRPRLSDLRESGSQEQDADVVILLWKREEPEAGKPRLPVEEIECIFAKNRNGRTGACTLAFRRHCMRFENWTPDCG